jgi:branched-chain amino acid aminotransferase
MHQKKSVNSSERVVYFNGSLVKESEAKISIYDSSLMFGDMVFEMTRSFNKKQFKLREHLERLYFSMKHLHISPPISIEEMECAVYKTINANEHLFDDNDEHRIMIDVSRGLLGIYEGIVGVEKGANVIIADFPLRWTVSSMGNLFDEGINAVITSQRAIPSHYLDARVKNRSRVHYLMANIEASKAKGKNNWALLLDDQGLIAEGSGDNFFIIKGGVVITPKGKNILRGVSREYIFALCKELRINCLEEDIDKYDVLTSNEAFMTGTPFCMLPVTSINNQPIGDFEANGQGKVGEIFNLLLNKWSENVGLDIKSQIQQYTKEAGGSDGVTPYAFK